MILGAGPVTGLTIAPSYGWRTMRQPGTWATSPLSKSPST